MNEMSKKSKLLHIEKDGRVVAMNVDSMIQIEKASRMKDEMLEH